MLNKLKSRKLWVTVAAAALISLASNLGISEAIATEYITLAVAYILGQGVVDAASELKNKS